MTEAAMANPVAETGMTITVAMTKPEMAITAPVAPVPAVVWVRVAAIIRGSVVVSVATVPIRPAAVAQTSLRSTGSISRGVIAGSNRDVAVESGLRLELNGELAPGVGIRASLTDAGVEIRGDERVRDAIASAKVATDKDYGTEYLALIISAKVVDDLDAAIAHVNKYSRT